MGRSKDVHAHLRHIIEEIGPRPMAGPGERAMADYAAAELRRIGLKAGIEKFSAPQWKYESTSLKLADDGISFPALAFFYSPGGRVSGKLESIGVFGQQGNMRRRSVRGKVCLAIGTGPGNLASSDCALELERKGAKALVLASLERDIDTKRIREPRLKKMPVVSITAETARAMLDHEGKEVVVAVDARTVPGHACNTVGIRKGRKNRRALFIAHTDTAPHTVGALDDGTGCAVLLSLAERMRKACPDWTFEFLFTGGDEYPGPPGQPHSCMAAYLKRHSLDGLEFFLEVDCVGNVHCPNQLLMGLPDKARTRLEQRLRGKDVYLEDYPGVGLANTIFQRGIPGMFLDSDYFLFVHIHTPADDMKVVSRQRLSEALDIAETSVRSLCSLPKGLGCSRT